MLLRRDVQRISIAQVRAAFRPSVYARLDEVRLNFAGTDVMVRIVKLPSSCKGGIQRALECPRCGRAVVVLGAAVDPASGSVVVGCRSRGCLAWREPPHSSTRPR